MLIDDCVTVDELKWLLKEEGEGIFESCDICPKNLATSYTVSLALFCMHVVILHCFFFVVLAYLKHMAYAS